MEDRIMQEAKARVAEEVARYGSARTAYLSLTVPFGHPNQSPEEKAFGWALFAAMNSEEV